MYLLEVVIDGFKSYAVRTTVSGFDPEFNAITGLNGSGKSNILDSICFVLGISNLSQVRASNLQELVYKQGQAGVQKASVTLVFNNDDTANSPLGYEQYDKLTITRQVVIGGRNKYLINGRTAQTTQVQNLFHSVQLNVNNPHFLIMQGRITKVLNMKPPEILSMLEEAAGTRLFEVKKDAALKTIEKKSRKVDEIKNVLDDEISPKLEKLRGERAGYMKWASNNTEIERHSRFCTAYDYHKADQTRSKAAEQMRAVQEDMKTLEAEQQEAMEVVSQQNADIDRLTQSKEEAMGPEFKKAENNVTELSKKMVKHASAWQNKKETHEAEIESCNNDRDAISDMKKLHEVKKQEHHNAQAACAEMQEAASATAEAAEDMQRKFLAGELSVDGGESSGSLPDQLEEAKSQSNALATSTKQLEIKIKHMRKELEAKQKEQGKGQTEHAAMLSEKQKLQKELNALTIQLHELDYNEDMEKELLSNKATEEQAVAKLREQLDDLSSQLSRIQFEYKDPVKNFDRSKVKGLVAELIELKDVGTAAALEVVAGGALYSVVVDSEQTGKLLLKSGKLKRRVTIIPLNKIDTRGVIADAKLKIATSAVGKSNVSTALSLVGYEPEVEAAMKYVFGRSFVCKDSKTAREVTFHKQIRTKCVTVDGDVFQPTGTLSGGSRSKCASVLERLQAVTTAEKQLEIHQRALARINGELLGVQDTAAKYRDLLNQKEVKMHAAELIQQRIDASSHQVQQAELQEIEMEVKKAREALVAVVDDKKKTDARCKDLQSEIKNFERDRTKKMREIEAVLTTSKSEAAKASKKAKTAAQRAESIALEMAELEKEAVNMKQQLSDRQAALSTSEKALGELELLANEHKSAYEEAKLDLDGRRQRICDCEKDIVKLTKVRNSAQKRMEKAQLELKRVAHKIARMEKENSGAEKLIESLLSKFPWIESEKSSFGQKNSDYDFGRRNPEAIREKLADLQAEQDELSKKINKKVMSMFEKAEQEYQDLLQRKTIIENDKSKIESVIDELQAKKNETLNKTWTKVNRDFGSIFSTLLPGANAKLEPEEGRSVSKLISDSKFGQIRSDW